MGNSAGNPDAHHARRLLIVKWHAQAHARLDEENIPRFADGLEYTLLERIDILIADRAVRGSNDE
jgi:hypothetical protein